MSWLVTKTFAKSKGTPETPWQPPVLETSSKMRLKTGRCRTRRDNARENAALNSTISVFPISRMLRRVYDKANRGSMPDEQEAKILIVPVGAIVVMVEFRIAWYPSFSHRLPRNAGKEPRDRPRTTDSSRATRSMNLANLSAKTNPRVEL